jgi:pyruvate/2-oxoglutarate dehydrogenase complex dihydrolipoamide dehydrogenase (E3) component
MAEGYDVIVIGTGAGGGTLARHLAPALTAMANAIRVGDHVLARLG